MLSVVRWSCQTVPVLHPATWLLSQHPNCQIRVGVVITQTLVGVARMIMSSRPTLTSIHSLGSRSIGKNAHICDQTILMLSNVLFQYWTRFFALCNTTIIISYLFQPTPPLTVKITLFLLAILPTLETCYPSLKSLKMWWGFLHAMGTKKMSQLQRINQQLCTIELRLAKYNKRKHTQIHTCI